MFHKGKKCKPMKMNIGRIIGAGIVFAIVAQIIHTIEAFGTMGYYMMEQYFPVWSKIMMPGMGPPGAEFFYYSIGFGIITGILFAAVYTVLGCCLPGKGMEKGIHYGFLVWLVAGIPSTLSMILLINLPLDLIAIWAISGLFVYIIGGALVAKILK